jgi:hypothetical protein
MAQPEGSPANGIALRGSDGSIYFIRDELMQACRVTEKDMSDALGQLIDGQGDVSGFSTSGDVGDGVRISGGTSRGTPEGLDARPRSTIMCPW